MTKLLVRNMNDLSSDHLPFGDHSVMSSEEGHVTSSDLPLDPYGEHETQEFDGKEANLHQHKKNCKKNPGHANFIPVNDFRLQHLPEVYRDAELYDLIMALVGLTVRVDVKVTSGERPQYWPGTKVRYPFYNSKSGLVRTGTAQVFGGLAYFGGEFADGFQHERGYTTCPCKQCRCSKEQNEVWWEFSVMTAAHVVFDEAEAQGTVLTLFYDSQESSVVKLDTLSVEYVSLEEDKCELVCATCDIDTSDRLLDMLKAFTDPSVALFNKFKSDRDVEKLTFLVSHPHGCSKQISVGQWVDKHQVDDDGQYKFTYNTCTCPGSSGATVYILGYTHNGSSSFHHFHSGSLKSGLNVCGAGVVVEKI
ncbi:hypothetical protein Btru_010807 [Bulinus truncatus]|nr:hypothetical protein Btru_010807 [Bulinus truncatus]